MKALQYILKSLAIMAACFCLSQLTVLFRGYSVDWPPLFITQRGLALALMVFTGVKYLIPVWLVSVLLNKFFWHTPFMLGAVSTISLIISLGLASYLYRRLCGKISPLHRVRDWLVFLLVVIPAREIFSFYFLKFIDLIFPRTEGLLNNQKFWAMADVLGLVVGFPLFLEIFNCIKAHFSNSKFLSGLPALVIGNTVGLLPFYLGIEKLNFLNSPGRYVSIFAMTSVGLFSTPLAMASSILVHAFWVAWSREGMIKSLSLKAADPSFDLQFYLLILSCFAPLIAIIVKSQRKEEYQDSFNLINDALGNSNTEKNLMGLGAKSDSVGVALFDLEFRCLQLNQKFADFSGYPLQTQLGKSSEERLGPNAKQIIPIFEEVVRTGKPIWNFRIHLTPWNKVIERELVCNYIPVFSSGGEVAAIIVVASEAKDKKSFLLQGNPEDLNAEEQKRVLSLALTHDLQEPLRNISQTLKILNERFKRRTDMESQNFLENALSATARLREMVQSSLELTQLDKVKLNQCSFESQELFEECLKTYSSDIEKVNAKISMGPLPKIKGDKMLLSRVVCNLLSNSLKYRGERELHIAISAKTENGKTQFTFSDNGIGFNNKDAELIFALFQRLVSSEEKEGYGVGLTVSRKIIEVHGGKMWAESISGEGSTFYFTLPVD